jgi:hypothetical protein
MSGVVSLPESVNVPALKQWFPRFIVVLEGAAAAAADPETAEPAPGLGDAAEQRLVRVVRAKGSGDDEIVRQAAETSGPCLVVTADRELRARCEAVGAAVTGPRWLLDLL